MLPAFLVLVKAAPNAPTPKPEIAKITGYKYKGIKTIFEKGEGAFKSNPQSVRKNVTSPQQWGYSRVYASVNKNSKAYKIDKIHLKKK